MITKLFIRLQPEDKRYGQPADRASYTGVYRANLFRAAYPILLYFFSPFLFHNQQPLTRLQFIAGQRIHLPYG